MPKRDADEKIKRLNPKLVLRAIMASLPDEMPAELRLTMLALYSCSDDFITQQTIDSGKFKLTVRAAQSQICKMVNLKDSRGLRRQLKRLGKFVKLSWKVAPNRNDGNIYELSWHRVAMATLSKTNGDPMALGAGLEGTKVRASEVVRCGPRELEVRAQLSPSLALGSGLNSSGINSSGSPAEQNEKITNLLPEQTSKANPKPRPQSQAARVSDEDIDEFFKELGYNAEDEAKSRAKLARYAQDQPESEPESETDPELEKFLNDPEFNLVRNNKNTEPDTELQADWDKEWERQQAESESEPQLDNFDEL
jgi:hypothetical protein